MLLGYANRKPLSTHEQIESSTHPMLSTGCVLPVLVLQNFDRRPLKTIRDNLVQYFSINLAIISLFGCCISYFGNLSSRDV